MPHISYSELKNWVQCPFYHKLVNIQKIKGFKGNEYTAFGTAIHNVCEKKLLKEQINDEEFFVSNFVSCDDPQSLWIGEIVRNGEQNYTDWKKRLQSLSYTFKSEIENVFAGKNFDEMFHIEGTKHPLIVKEHLGKNISLESLVLLNKIIGFKNNFDKKLNDPVWKFLSMRMSKYDSFLHIDVIKYRKILKSIVV